MGKARTLLALILLGVFVFPGNLFAQEKKAIVILPFTGADLPKAELTNLTLVFEQLLMQVNSLQVIDQSRRERVLAYLDPVLLTCEDIDCAVRVGKAVSATTVVMSTVVGESGRIAINMRVITVASRKSIRTQSEPVASPAELSQSVRLLASALFGAPLVDIGVAGSLSNAQADQQRLHALETLYADLQESIAQIQMRRAKAQAWGWLSLGIGAAAAALSGVSWYLSDLAYANYLSTSDTDEAARYHQQVVMWDTIMLASAGTGVLSVGISIPIFVLSPDNSAEMAELKRVELDISAIRSPAGIGP